MANTHEFEDKVAFHPGYYIAELIKDSSPEEMAKKLHITPEKLTELVNGEQDITEEIARGLADATGTTACYWFNLQHAYDSIMASYHAYDSPGEGK